MESENDKIPSTELKTSETIVVATAVVLLLFLVYTISQVVSPFLLVGAVLFLLYPLRDRPLIRSVMWLSVLLFGIWFVYTLGGVIAPFVAAFLLAYLLDPLIVRMERLKMARWASALVVLVGFFGLVTVGAIFIMPIAFNQFQAIIERTSSLVNEAVVYLQQGQIFETFAKYGFPAERLRELLTTVLTPRLDALLRSIFEGAFGIFNSLSAIITQIINLIVIPFLTFYFLKDFSSISGHLRNIVPQTQRATVYAYAQKVDHLFGKYLRGALTVALIHGVLASLLLSLFGINYPLVLGMLAGVLSLIPYFGLLTSLALSVLVALFSGEPVMLKVLFVLLTFGILQILEFSVLSPAILGKHIGLHPVLLILSLLVFGFFLGFIGLIIAVPTTAFLVMSVREWRAHSEHFETLPTSE